MSRINRVVVFTSQGEVEGLFPEDITPIFSNVKYWNGKARGDADAVYAPHLPKVEAVYEAAGKIVYRPTETPEDSKEEAVVSDDVEETVEPVVEGTDESPETDWRDLSWPKMRSLAATLTDEPIKSKEFAKEVLTKAEEEGRI